MTRGKKLRATQEYKAPGIPEAEGPAGLPRVVMVLYGRDGQRVTIPGDPEGKAEDLMFRPDLDEAQARQWGEKYLARIARAHAKALRSSPPPPSEPS